MKKSGTKIMALFLALVLLAGSAPLGGEGITLLADWTKGLGAVTANAAEKYTLGDVDGSGDISAADARLALRAAVGLENYAKDSKEFLAADADKSGDITAADARLILRAAVGLETLNAAKPEPGEADVGRLYTRDFSPEDVAHEEDGVMDYVRNEILLVAKDGVTFDEVETLAKAAGGEIVGCIEITGDYQIAFENKTEQELKSLIEGFEASPLIDSAMLNYVTEITTDAVSVNDPWYDPKTEDRDTNLQDWDESNPSGRNWGLEAIKAPSAWEYADEMSDIKIGIIDDGFDYDHNDLKNVIVWKSESEKGNHGTHVLGTFAAETNNETGISGVFPNRLNGDTPKASAYTYFLDDAIYFFLYKAILTELVVRNVKVINISQGYGYWLSLTYAASIGNADAREYLKKLADPLGDHFHKLLKKGYDFVVCQSAGNQSATALENIDQAYIKDEKFRFGWRTDTSGSLSSIFGKHDAKYNSPFTAIDNHQDVVDRIIVVGAVYNKGIDDKGNHKGYGVCSFSNWGPRVDVLAPGEKIYSAITNNTYDKKAGTSMATPHVSGTAAMVWAANTSLSGSMVKQIICETADTPIKDTFNSGDPLFHYDDTHYTNGLLNAQAAVEEAIRRRSPSYTPGFQEKLSGAVVTKVVDEKNLEPLLDENGNVRTDISVYAYPIINNKVFGLPTSSAKVDKDGDVYLFALAGKYELRVNVDGYETASIRVEIASNEVTKAELIKLKAMGLVGGLVNDDETDEPLSGVTVQFTNKDTEETYNATTKKDGTYSCKMPYGEYSLVFSKEEYEDYSRSLTVNKKNEIVGVVLLSKESSSDETIVESGSCGETVKWKLNSEGRLTISGTGQMEGYRVISKVPWYNLRPSIKSVVIKSGVTNIGSLAFYECPSLTSVSIGKGVTIIGDSAFAGCARLSSMTIPDNVTSIEYAAFRNCTDLTTVEIGKGVKSIGNYAFEKCIFLSDVTIPDNVTTLGRYAFFECKRLASVTIGKGVTDVGGHVFSLCEGLTSLTIQKGITSIGECMFSACKSLTDVTIPDSVTSIGNSAFYNCEGLTSITIPDSVTSIGTCAFTNCKGLPSIRIPERLTKIENQTFEGCTGLTSITIPDSVLIIGNCAFRGCSGLSSVEIGKSVMSIWGESFFGCTGLTSVTIPDNVTTIGLSAFYNCENLTSVTIPDSVTQIGIKAFKYCNELKDVYYTGSEEKWNEIVIGYDNNPLKEATIHYNA